MYSPTEKCMVSKRLFKYFIIDITKMNFVLFYFMTTTESLPYRRMYN